MSDLLAGTGPYTPTLTWEVDGVATDVGAVTIGIVDVLGDEVVAPLTATTNNADGTYKYELADQAVNLLTATWTRSDNGAAIVVDMEVAGGVLFTLGDLKAFRTGLSAETAKRLAEARRTVTDEFGAYCGVDFVPRPRHEILDGTGTNTLVLRRRKATRLLALKVDGVSEDVNDFDLYEHGAIRRDGVWVRERRDVEVLYEAGYTVVPADIRRAGLQAAAYQILGDSSTTSPRARQLATDFGTTTFARFAPTGLPDVDAVLARYRAPLVG